MGDPGWPYELVLSSASAGFFQLYSPPEGGIFVAEPVTHANAALNEPESEWPELGMRVLQPGVKSEALPVIWQQVPTFRKRAAGLAGAAHQTAAAAASGNLDATRTAASTIGPACKACHDTFREKK
jgi:cytochrome c556